MDNQPPPLDQGAPPNQHVADLLIQAPHNQNAVLPLNQSGVVPPGQAPANKNVAVPPGQAPANQMSWSLPVKLRKIKML